MKRFVLGCSLAVLAGAALVTNRSPAQAPANPPAPDFYSYFAPRPKQASAADDVVPVALANEERKVADGKSASATIELRLPANSQFWFERAPTSLTGAVRHFVTPPLTPGHTYTYTVRVRWVAADGVVYDMTRQVEVEPGRETVAGIIEPPVTLFAATTSIAVPTSSANRRLQQPPRSR
jgi:uncharacterized protein (TIGR03000 family)